MATYAIGDVQGCMTSLERMLALIDYRPGRDRLWLVGDLVNRGPRSLDVLRWAARESDAGRLVTVLGNHDVHLLARAAGVAAPKKRDTLDQVLAAPDRGPLLDWLRRRPLVHREGGWFLLHAGLLPSWTLDQAESAAREVEAELRGPGGDGLLAAAGPDGGGADRWRDGMARRERLELSLFAFTRLRVCHADGRVERDFDGEPSDAPAGARPWFALRRPEPETLIFGHWAALGFQRAAGRLALDSGCVWGQALTAVRLDDGRVYHQPSAEA